MTPKDYLLEHCIARHDERQARSAQQRRRETLQRMLAALDGLAAAPLSSREHERVESLRRECVARLQHESDHRLS